MSRSDGTSTAVLEAMACGLFPILSDIPQNRALLRGSESRGILVPLDDDEALKKAILRVLCEPTTCHAQAAANRNFVATYANATRNRQLLTARLTKIVQDDAD
jgi:glycosyltransferase involved in cell wall biosynthesis